METNKIQNIHMLLNSCFRYRTLHVKNTIVKNTTEPLSS